MFKSHKNSYYVWSTIPVGRCPALHDCERKQGSGPKRDEVLLNTGALLVVHSSVRPSVYPSPQALSSLKSALSGLKSTLSGFESVRTGLCLESRVESDSGFQSPPIFRDFLLPPPFFVFFSDFYSASAPHVRVDQMHCA